MDDWSRRSFTPTSWRRTICSRGFGISLFNDRRFTFLSIIRSKKAGAPADEELRLLAQLTPHLQRALQVHERLELSSPLGATALAALDELKRGVVFVGPDRNMIYANRAAERILAGRDGLFLDGKGALPRQPRRRAGSARPPSRRRDRGALASRRRRVLQAAGVMLLQRPSGARAFGLVVAPMPSPPFGFAAAHVAAAILISDPESDSAALRDILRRLYQLSEREAEIAVRIAEGERLEGAAQNAGITYETARSYLKAIFMKLGVNRQAETCEPRTKARSVALKQKGRLAPPFSDCRCDKRLSAWRTGSSRAPCGGRTSCARRRGNRG